MFVFVYCMIILFIVFCFMGFKKLVFVVVLVVFVISWIYLLWFIEQVLYSILIVIGLVVLLWVDCWGGWLGNGVFIVICGFIVLYCVGVCWLYFNVFYDVWVQVLIGWLLNVVFGWQCNYFDWFIYFLFGVCFMFVLLQLVCYVWLVLCRGQVFILVVMVVMCVSLVYEWFEWVIVLVFLLDVVEVYNGQQGDMWDVYVDMLLVIVGSLLSWLLICWCVL